jgi:hypothetical protein
LQKTATAEAAACACGRGRRRADGVSEEQRRKDSGLIWNSTSHVEDVHEQNEQGRLACEKLLLVVSIRKRMDHEGERESGGG